MIHSMGLSGSFCRTIPSIALRISIRIAAIIVIALAFSASVLAQDSQTPEALPGQIMGTVLDVNGDAVPGATVTLAGPQPSDHRTATTNENGFFKFDGVTPGVSYQVAVGAQGFADWTSAVTLNSGEVKMFSSVQLDLAAQETTVRVSADTTEIATEQMKLEETQRVFGFIPNFYISYEGDNFVPLTAGVKFKLALRVSRDPVTIAGVGFVAAIRQANRYPDYGEGMKGYAERFGATAGPAFTDIMIGGAILPSLLHQDPRYFYQGTGTTGSRLRHAILGPFICKGDNGRWQPNYSSVGGDLAAAGISNLYFPKQNRGAGFVFSTFGIGTAERIISTVGQEFVLSKFTHRGTRVD